MNIRKHKELVAEVLKGILAQPNARTAAQHELYLIKASLLTKRK